MDESGNKQDDRFFVCGFLDTESPFEFTRNLQRVRDQVFDTIQKQRTNRALNLYNDLNLIDLYSLAKKQAFFELKFDKITLATLKLYKDLILAMNSKCVFRFKAVVIDRSQPSYVHESLEGMYKRVTHLYFDHCQKTQCIFVPDQADPNTDWEKLIGRPNIVRGVLPAISDAVLPIQVVDVLTGIVRLGLEIKSGDKKELGRNDITRKELVDLFEKEFKIKISTVSNSKPDAKNYVGIWTIDFDKSKKAKA